MAKKPHELPVVRLNLLHPMLAELQRRNIDCGATLADFGLTPLAVQEQQVFVSVPVMYALVESLSGLAGDPYFGVRVGERVDPWTYSPLAEAAANALTLGEFLLRFAINVNADTTSIRCVLESGGTRSTFYWRRVSDGGICPAHNDGFDIAYLLAILKSTLETVWEGREVIARVCEPKVVPPDYLSIRVAATDTLGPSVSFPSQWLLAGAPTRQLSPSSARYPSESPAGDMVDALHQILQSHLQEEDLTVERVAGLLDLSRRTLARRLQASGTTLRAELAQLRSERAEQLLREGKLSVAEVGAAVGYPDGAAFSRAFRRWTGLSPKQLQRQTPAS